MPIFLAMIDSLYIVKRFLILNKFEACYKCIISWSIDTLAIPRSRTLWVPWTEFRKFKIIVSRLSFGKLDWFRRIHQSVEAYRHTFRIWKNRLFLLSNVQIDNYDNNNNTICLLFTDKYVDSKTHSLVFHTGYKGTCSNYRYLNIRRFHVINYILNAFLKISNIEGIFANNKGCVFS